MTTTTSYQNVSWENTNTFTDFISNASQSAGGYLFAGIDFLVFMVLFVTLAGAFGWEAGILSAGFIGIVLSLLFSYMGVLSWVYTSIFVGVILFMIMYVIWSNRYD